ncbi:MAG: leucyl aminopeptidase [Candidatus Promineifilaceae bacterium]|jgi:leucyl aminopeptidase
MKINVERGNLLASQADTIIVNLFEGVTIPGGATGAVDSALDGAISELIAGGDFSGKAGEIAVLYPRGAINARRVLITGLGKQEKFDLEGVRHAAATAVKRARDLNASHVATIVHGAGIAGLPVKDAAQATAEGTLLALHRYPAQKQKEEAEHDIDGLSIIEFDADKIPAIEEGVAVAQALAAGVTLARDLVNMPANQATPTFMADTAQTIADEHGLNSFVGGRKWAREQNLGAFLAVAQGAGEKPKFIILEHNSNQLEMDTIVLVGKGITFDTGGISLKPVAGMGDMKGDMGGAAAVLGAMKVIADLDLPLHVVGITPCTENMPDADAYRPADVITASNGKTIEIISTDAEGRMILADALVYAQRYNPKAVIDLATLTGACIVALGQGIAAGVFSNEDDLSKKLVAAGEETSERLWPLPLWDVYRKAIDTDVADMKNSGGRMGGVATSAIFLREFTDYNWAHLDIAGVAMLEKAAKPYNQNGATGFGVRLLVELLRNW